jgi:hypothetical protein
VLDGLTLIQAAQTGLLNGRDGNEYVFPASLRLDGPVALVNLTTSPGRAPLMISQLEAHA